MKSHQSLENHKQFYGLYGKANKFLKVAYSTFYDSFWEPLMGANTGQGRILWRTIKGSAGCIISQRNGTMINFFGTFTFFPKVQMILRVSNWKFYFITSQDYTVTISSYFLIWSTSTQLFAFNYYCFPKRFPKSIRRMGCR